jgi:uridine kinase
VRGSYSRGVQAFESVSTWRQPLPSPASADRTAVTGEDAARIARLSPARLRVGVDGLTAAGKTSFGHELAAALRGLSRPAMRASMDDFKHPWRHARELGYDRVTGEGYYRNACDFTSARNLLLSPAGPGGTGEVVLCAHDPLTHAAEMIYLAEVRPQALADLIIDNRDFTRPRIWTTVVPDQRIRFCRVSR